MLASVTTSAEQERAVKRLRVDSPSASLECDDDGEGSTSSASRWLATHTATEAAQCPSPATAQLVDTPAPDVVDGDSPAGASSALSPMSSRVGSDVDGDSDGDSNSSRAGAAGDGSDAVHLSPPPPPSPSRGNAQSVASPSTRFTVSSVGGGTLSPPITANGALTTLRSLGQLQTLVSNANTTAARERTHPSLRLKPGETVLLLLHFDEASLRSLVSDETAELSQMRVFTLNLARLPAQDYERLQDRRLSTGGGGGRASSGETSACAGGAVSPNAGGAPGPTASASVAEVKGGKADDEDEEEDEEELMPAVRAITVAAAAEAASAAAVIGAGAERERPTRDSVSAAGDDVAGIPSLSVDLHHASDAVRDKLQHILEVDTILNPQQHHHHRGDGTPAPITKKEPLLFPAMVAWRAAGAPREEYPPEPPQRYSSQPSLTPAELFCDRLAAHGGPLVVKEATGVEQVHSLTLFRPVFTMENLFQTLVRAVAPSFATLPPGDKSCTLLYLGASWCPPCMRFVREMPQLIRKDLPPSVVCTLKADMDLAKPIYDCLKVEIIPTFVVLDNEVLMQCHDTMQQRGSSGVTPSDTVRVIQDAVARAELGRIQSSARQTVSTFISKHTQALRFDEDF